MQKSTHTSDPLHLVLLGDIFLGGDLTPKWREPGFDPFSRLHALVEPGSVLMATVETVFRRGPLRPRRSGHLYGPPESVESLKRLGLTVAGFAHNHAMDFGSRAMLKSVELLRANGIECIGCGWNQREASTGCIVERNGLRLGFLAYTSGAYHVRSVLAGACSVGSAPIDPKRMAADIRRLRSAADVVCVSLHWGFEYIHVPHPDQRRLASYLVENGADVILGSHPHTVQGYEIIAGKPVFYSMGNLVFPEYEKLYGDRHTWGPENDLSLMADIRISRDESGGRRFDVSIIPLRFRFPEVTVLTGTERQRFEDDLALWCAALRQEAGGREIMSRGLEEMKRRDRAWRHSFPRRMARRMFYEPLELLLGPHRMDAVRHYLSRR